MPNELTGTSAKHKGRSRTSSRRRDNWTRRAVGLALVLTLLVLVALIGLKIATNANWRAVTLSSWRVCAYQESAPNSGDPLPSVGHLAGCVARRNPVRNDPIELVTLAGLTTLAAVEIGYLTRHH